MNSSHTLESSRLGTTRKLHNYTYKPGDRREAVWEAVKLLGGAAYESKTTRIAILTILGLIGGELAGINQEIRQKFSSVLMIKTNGERNHSIVPNILIDAVREEHPGSDQYRALHHNKAEILTHGEMGPVDRAVQVLLGKERFAKEMVKNLEMERALGDDRSATEKEKELVREIYSQ